MRQWTDNYSDTTAPSLTLVFYFLARYPMHAEKIYEEIQGVDRENPAALAMLPHLTGTINEAMRLLPAVLTFSSRITPPEGLMIDGTFIPGNTKICAPRYTIGRREKSLVISSIGNTKLSLKLRRHMSTPMNLFPRGGTANRSLSRIKGHLLLLVSVSYNSIDWCGQISHVPVALHGNNKRLAF